VNEQGRALAPMRRVPPAERFAIVLAALVLAGLAFLFVLVTIDLVAAASGSAYSVWDHVGLPSGSGDRVGLLFAGVVVGVLLTVAGLRLRDPVLKLSLPDGVIVLRVGAVEKSLVTSISQDPDVLRTEVRVRVRRGDLKTEVLVLARPLTNVERLRAEADTRMHAALCRAIGMSCPPLRVDVHCVPVKKLARYL
jgi:hypothetical protein